MSHMITHAFDADDARIEADFFRERLQQRLLERVRKSLLESVGFLHDLRNKPVTQNNEIGAT